ncbi:MAG: glutathione S-transferase N-terminal domain-containing protein [Pseudomonadota bacterium]
MLYPLLYGSSVIASALRLGAGWGKANAGQGAPETLPILYEFEGCPYCRIAREAVSEAGLSVLVRPCPKGGRRFRPDVAARGGKAQFPFFIDPNTGDEMYESADIARHIRRNYGRGASPLHYLGPFNGVLSQFSTLSRLAAGTFRRNSRDAERPLEFIGAERDPGARLVKERLCALELPYVWRPTGAARLADPNTDQEISGARAIRAYLATTYGA